MNFVDGHLSSLYQITFSPFSCRNVCCLGQRCIFSLVLFSCSWNWPRLRSISIKSDNLACSWHWSWRTFKVILGRWNSSRLPRHCQENVIILGSPNTAMLYSSTLCSLLDCVRHASSATFSTWSRYVDLTPITSSRIVISGRVWRLELFIV